MKGTKWICPDTGETCRAASRGEMAVFCFVMVVSLVGWFFAAELVFKLFMAPSV
jgi:hypothetical protein